MLAMASGLLTTSTGNVAAALATMRNEHLAVLVENNGIFELRTAGDQQLTYPNPDTSGLTVQVDGTNYVIGAAHLVLPREL